jgi:hypothetical protein
VDRYFYIRDYEFNLNKTRIERLFGYYTDMNHNSFFPAVEISREEAIAIIRSRDILFLEDGCYRMVKIKLVKVEDQEYLRVDHFSKPLDYFG